MSPPPPPIQSDQFRTVRFPLLMAMLLETRVICDYGLCRLAQSDDINPLTANVENMVSSE